MTDLFGWSACSLGMPGSLSASGPPFALGALGRVRRRSRGVGEVYLSMSAVILRAGR